MACIWIMIVSEMIIFVEVNSLNIGPEPPCWSPQSTWWPLPTSTALYCKGHCYHVDYAYYLSNCWKSYEVTLHSYFIECGECDTGRLMTNPDVCESRTRTHSVGIQCLHLWLLRGIVSIGVIWGFFTFSALYQRKQMYFSKRVIIFNSHSNLF